jgi:hypothetical protein
VAANSCRLSVGFAVAQFVVRNSYGPTTGASDNSSVNKRV